MTLFIVAWLMMGLIGVVLFIWSEVKSSNLIIITLATILKVILLVLSGPIACCGYLWLWGDTIVIWKRDKG